MSDDKVHDAEEIERLRARLAELEAAQLETPLLDVIGTLVIVLDEAGCVVHMNHAAESLFGTSAAALRGAEFIGRYVLPDEQADLRAACRMTLAEGTPQQGENVWRCVDERYCYIAWQTAAWRQAPDAPIHLILSGVNVTDKREFEVKLAQQARDLARSNRELENFAYIASHDLQEPLRMVTSYLNLLERRYMGQLDEDAHDFIGYAVDGAGRMKRLINALLDYSRLNAYAEPFQTVDLDAVLQDVLTDLQVRIQESGAQIIVEPLPTVTGDPTQLRRLLQNLIENAIKFRHPDRPPRIDISGYEDATDYTVRVQDNGIGFDEKYQERIFVIFQRLHIQTEYGGTGLGLAMAKRIVELHGGRISASSPTEGGAMFVFILPRNPIPQHYAFPKPVMRSFDASQEQPQHDE